MAEVGRNEPCPCGSGRKSKHCCGRPGAAKPAPSTAPREGQRSTWHDVDERVTPELVRFVAKHHPDLGELFPYEPGRHDMSLYGPWLFYEVALDDGRRVVDCFLEERGRMIGARERTWLEAQRHAWLSVWQATEVVPRRSITLLDRFTGAERRVNEISASEDLRPGLCVLARVVDVEGESVLVGMHPSPLPGPVAAEAVTFLRKELRVRRPQVPVERLRAPEVAEMMIAIWQETIELEHARPRPQLVNTDGDPLVLTVDRYDLVPARRDEVIAALEAIDLSMVEAAPPPGEYAIGLAKKGNAQHASWDNTIIARVRVLDATVLVETNSVRRADDARRIVERATGSAIRWHVREHTDPEAALERAHRAPPAPPEPLAPEALEAVREMKERHYRGWIDQPLPALGGRTPRQAAAQKRSRARVADLLTRMEYAEIANPPELRFDVSILRRELGL